MRYQYIALYARHISYERTVSCVSFFLHILHRGVECGCVEMRILRVVAC